MDRHLEFLGWTIDLDARTITLCDRNLHKLIHALFSFQESTKMSVSHLQRIASLTSRAAILNRLMKPFTHELHTITSGYTQPHIKIKLTMCLRYVTLQAAIKECAAAFGFNPDWFNPHSARIGGPTAAAAAGEQKETIMVYGRWKSVPNSLVYQRSSTKSNNRMLRLLTNPTLYTSRDIQLGQILPRSSRQGKKASVRRS